MTHKEDMSDTDTRNSEYHKQSYPTTRFSQRVRQNNGNSNTVSPIDNQAYPLGNDDNIASPQEDFNEDAACETFQSNDHLSHSPMNDDIEDINNEDLHFNDDKPVYQGQGHHQNFDYQRFVQKRHNDFEQSPVDDETYPDTGGADDIGLYNEDGLLDENAAFLAQHNSEHSGFGDNSERSSDEDQSEGGDDEDIDVDIDLRLVDDEETCISDTDGHRSKLQKNTKQVESSPHSNCVRRSTTKEEILNGDEGDHGNTNLAVTDQIRDSTPAPTSDSRNTTKVLQDTFKSESISNTVSTASKSTKSASKSTKSASKSREKSALTEGFSFPECIGKYTILKKIGYGSFSEVYKAVSLPHKRTFVTKRITDASGASRIVSVLPSEFYPDFSSPSFSVSSSSSSSLSSSSSSSLLKSKQDTFEKYKEFIEKPSCSTSRNGKSDETEAETETETKSPLHTFSHIEVEVPGGQLVALKRITLTTSAARALAEALFLRRLGAHPYIASLHFIEIDPESGQITLVLPFVEHTSFREYYNNMSLTEIQLYMYALFSAIAHLEKHKVLHRDIKPSNFLYNRKTGEFCLVDLGLSQMFSHLDTDEVGVALEGASSNPTQTRPTGEVKSDLDEVINRILALESSTMTVMPPPFTSQIRVFDLSVPEPSPLIAEIPDASNVNRPSSFTKSSTSTLSSRQAQEKKEKSQTASVSIHSISPASIPPRRPIPVVPRWGTRGFRAPEVLLRSRMPQTSALDVWSAGITLLTILSQRYPVLNSADDLSGLAEILRLWGRTEMELTDRSVVLENAAVVRGGLRTFIRFCCPLVRWPEEVLDLCEKALELDPEKRLTAVEALSHPFFAMDGRTCDREIAKTVRFFAREKSSKSKTDKKTAIKV